MENENNKELTIVRTFDAPRELVWKAWIDEKMLAKWWGPNGITIPVCTVDMRVGGAMRIVMLAGKELGSFAGTEWPMTGTVTEIVEPEKLVFVSSPIIDDKPIMDTLSTMTLKEVGDKTEMTLRIVVTRTTPAAEGPLSGMEMGWNQSINKLAKFLERK
jgi:uncharacterized protein YndB with AHSA1/START domain